jgi:hypothetical protein
MRYLAALMLALLLTVTAQAQQTIVIQLDTSGSMSDYMRSAQKSRMEVAQDALIEVLSKVPDGTKVGILTFDGWIYDIQPVNRAALEQAIRNTRPGGGTPLYEYVQAAGTQLLAEREKQLNIGTYKLLVITDGAAGDDHLNRDGQWSDGTVKPGVLKDIMSRNITVDAIGLDMSGDHALATQINGSYMRGDDPNSLVEAVSQAVAEVPMDDPQASDEAFKEIGELPDEFVGMAIKGLTKFSNHPIGERPPVPVVAEDGSVVRDENGDIMYQPDPVEEVSSFPGWLGWVCGGIFVVICIIGLLSVLGGSGRRY